MAVNRDASQPTTSHHRDFDSAYEEILSSSVSLTSAQYLFEKRNGRTYHSFAKNREYVLPNDEPERDRLDMQFWAFHEILDDAYHFAPIGDNPQRILDVGTGTGTWAIDMGDEYPSAIVTGTDLSPIQPLWVPPNVAFRLHDCLHYPWDFYNQFDLIHTQMLNGFAVKDWFQFYTEAYKNLKPGGWIECHEADSWVRSDDESLPPDGAIVTWLELWFRGGGKEYQMSGQDLADDMRKAGFVDITVKEFKAPIGPWMKSQINSGILSLNCLVEHLEGFSNRIFTEKLGMTNDEMKAVVRPAVREWRNKSVHTYWPL
ncbi:MAG: hypothetical protein M1818_005615 [Claussenomyces sp. TS43310]|nr:MAG: hypothetical protein M1818_005615 [Claussenomyces sp. TS43310]